MKIMLNIILTLIWTCIFMFAQGNVMAQSRSNVDVAIVMDSSGSMKKTDPRSLRIPAAKLFISLLGSSDRAAVLSFSDQGYAIADLTSVNNEANKKKLLNATDQITSKGLHTNLYGAFNKGMEVLLDAKEDGRDQIIVLMSDGMMDVGDHEEDMQLLAKLKSDLSGVLKKNNIKVYAIAFTDQSDKSLLEKLSKQTGGFYNLALTDKDFHLIFTSIFESLKSPEMLPMENNGFLIDGSIQEVTIVVSKESAATDIHINSPDGQTYSGNQKYSGISWFVSENFDMITVQKPVEGRWEILYSTGENNKAYIITDLKLETNFEQLYAVFGEDLDIKAWLEKEGAIIRNGEVLETTDIYIELNNPDGNISNLKPLNSGDGIFHKTITPFKDGNYRLRVVAKGKTYEREKAFLFNVANLKESKEDLKAAREARNAEKAEDQEHSEEEEHEPVNWAKIIFQFISLNLIIGILVVAYMKRQSIKDFKLIGKLFKRSKDTKPLQAKTKEPEESHTEAESETEEPAEQETDQIDRVSKINVVLEDEDSDGKEVEQGNEEEDQEPVKERVALEEAAYEEDEVEETGDDGAMNNLEEEIQRLEKLKQEDGDIQTTEASENNVSEKEVNTDKTNEEEQSEAQSPQEEIQETPEVKAEEENANEPDTEVQVSAENDNEDDMWADAMNEQAEAASEEGQSDSTVEEQKTDEQTPQPEDVKEPQEFKAEAQVEVETDAEDIVEAEEKDGEDSVDDMWADAMNEQATAESIEEKTESKDEEPKTDGQAPKAESKESPETKTEEIKKVSAAVNADTEQLAREETEMVTEIHELDEENELANANKADVDENGEGEIDAMWAAALYEQANVEESIEKTASTAVDNSPENTGPDEVKNKKDADQMWTEALSEHAEASEENLSESKDNTGGSPGAAS
jgi:hypothetical protein